MASLSKSEEFSLGSHFSVSSLFLFLDKISYSICLSDLKCQVGISCRPLPLPLIIHSCQNQLPPHTPINRTCKRGGEKELVWKKVSTRIFIALARGKRQIICWPEIFRFKYLTYTWCEYLVCFGQNGCTPQLGFVNDAFAKDISNFI